MGKEIEMKLLTTQAGCHRLFAARDRHENRSSGNGKAS